MACKKTFCCSSDQTDGSGGVPPPNNPSSEEGVWERERGNCEEGRGAAKWVSSFMVGTGGSRYDFKIISLCNIG